MKYATLIIMLFASISVKAEEGLLIAANRNPVISEITGKPMFAEAETFESFERATVSPYSQSVSFSSPDLKSYYMGADIGSAFKARHYRTNVKGWKGKVWQVGKAPFVAVGQTLHGISRTPRAMFENGKKDPLEAVAQAAVIILGVGSQTDWYGLDADDKGKKDSESFNSAGVPLEHPGPDVKSFQQSRATRDSCEFIGSSSQNVKIDAVFGDSGSSECHIDTNEPTE